ncbi:MAG TPA: pyridoxal 5'-phosphate synthase glutaminase subunit PdxT [Planctomycetes bacterium]|nr:pyridoxal 5'-phosphate synthase glutaminase subunit PdxT [Planctomycetota bacterium]
MVETRFDPSGPVGVLAVQGDFQAHAAAVEETGFRPVEVRRPGELQGLSALVLPGGESTTMLKFFREEGLEGEVLAFCREGGPVLATCAGVILLARRVTGPDQPSLGILDVDLVRNGYGRQVHSSIHRIRAEEPLGEIEAVFIRAPRIIRAGPGVQVLARLGEDPVLLRQGPIVAATFHPELSRENPVHRWFLERVARVES